MNTIIACFASRRYWPDPDQLQVAYLQVIKSLPIKGHPCLITEDSDLSSLGNGGCLVLIPMSGAVQRQMLLSAQQSASAVLYAAYIRGNIPDDIHDEMIRANAAPALMDTWSVLKRSHPSTMIALNPDNLLRSIRVLDAKARIKHAKLLLIGKTEPWVISTSEDFRDYERLGVTIEPVEQREAISLYKHMTESDAMPYYQFFASGAKGIREPTETDLLNASRMAAVLDKLLTQRDADGMAIACFNLLQTGTNACLGVSYINDATDKIASCEGDLDSAVTMLMMKNLASTRLWMANPCLEPNGTVHFSHCTAPVSIDGYCRCPYILRSHHESGIGVSLQVELPVNRRLTACRVSDHASKITIHGGISINGPHECACRTQMNVRLDDPVHYLDTALGCHQVFAFEDIRENMELLAKQLGLTIL